MLVCKASSPCRIFSCPRFQLSLSETDSANPTSTNVSGDIGLELFLHSEVHGFEDEGARVTKLAARRKLQNQLNQRAHS